MSRESEFTTNTNPATHYITWKSDQKAFESYDKDAKTKETLELPFEFTVLKVGSSVKGWSDTDEAAIYSNIITNSIRQDLTVRCGSSVIATGKYQEIKDKIVAAGAHFESNIFALYNGSIVMISLKGSALGKWFDFTKTVRGKLKSHKVVIKTSEAGKKGAVKFNTPKFELSDAMSIKEADAANLAWDDVDTYLLTPPSDEVNEIEVTHEPITPNDGDDSDLPF